MPDWDGVAPAVVPAVGSAVVLDLDEDGAELAEGFVDYGLLALVPRSR